MKNIYKIASLLLTVGLLFLVIGKLNGSSDLIKLNDNNDSWRIEKTAFSTQDHHRQSHHHDQDISVSHTKAENFNRIQLDVSATDVHVRTGDKYSIEIVTTKTIKPKTKIKHGILTIHDKKTSGNWHFSSRNCHHWGARVTITVPHQDSIREISGTSQAGDIQLKHLNLQKLNITTKAGEVALDESKSADTRIATTAGDISIESATLGQSTLKAIAGDISLDQVNAKIIKLSTEFGDVKLNDGSAQITANLEMGDAELDDFKLLGDSSFKLANGDFEADDLDKAISLDLKTTTGDIDCRDHEHSKHFKYDGHGAKLTVTTAFGDIKID